MGNKRVWYCHNGIDCAGCRTLHHSEHMGSKMTPDGEWCSKWYKSTPSIKSRMSNMSPEEVVSGGLHGLPNQFPGHSADYTKAVKQSQRKEVLKALS